MTVSNEARLQVRAASELCGAEGDGLTGDDDVGWRLEVRAVEKQLEGAAKRQRGGGLEAAVRLELPVRKGELRLDVEREARPGTRGRRATQPEAPR